MTRTNLITALTAVLLTACYSTHKLNGDMTECRAECYDDDPCTEDVCDIEGNCLHFPIPGCGAECTADLDCEDGIDCTIDYCDSGVCAQIDNCVPDPECLSADDCEDGIDCTIDYCDSGVCAVVDMCEETCDSEVHSFSVPMEVLDMDVAVKDDTIALVWQNDDSDTSMSYVSTNSLDAPVDLSYPSAIPIDERDDVGVRHARVIWPDANPMILWASRESGVQSIKMAELDVPASSLSVPIELYHDHHSALSQVVYHPSGELGITWTDWADEGSDPNAFFGRFTMAGDAIEIQELSDGEYSYAPQLEALSDGYTFAFTHYLDEPDHSNALMKHYSFSGGMDMSPTRLNTDDGRFIAGAVTATMDQELALMYHEVAPGLRLLSLNRLPDGEAVSIPLFLMSGSADALGSPDGEDAFIGWCTPEMPGSPSSIAAIRVSSSSVTLMFYQEMEGDGVYCEDVELTMHGEEPMIFWLDTKNTISFRSLCLP